MKLKKIRKANGITQTQLAELMDVGQSTISGWENGSVNIPSDKLPLLADIFDCTIDALYGREDRDTA